jgi:hypothetical protein
MADLQSPTLIKAKGLMFLAIAGLSAYLLWADDRTLRTISLLALLVWSASRFYYFLFYVLERYVDPSLRYTGLVDQVLALVKHGRQRGGA